MRGEDDAKAITAIFSAALVPRLLDWGGDIFSDASSHALTYER